MSRPACKDLTAAEQDALARTVQTGSARVERLVLPSGRVLWIKRIETLRPLMRLQKGDPAAAFDAELAAIRGLGSKGHPVPEVVASGPGHIVLSDGGPSLHDLVATGSLAEAEARRAFVAVGRALAALHRDGFAHGRPVLRDFCWADDRLTMIDLERCVLRPRSPVARALDLVIFAQGWFARRGAQEEDTGLLDVAVAAYRAAGAPDVVWAGLARLSRWLTRLAWLPRLALRLKPDWREMQAAVWTIGYLRRLVDRG